MIDHRIFIKGALVITRASGVVKRQELVDHVFWLIDSHNIGEIKPGFSQLIYVENIVSMTLKEADILQISEISNNMGRARGWFRTAVVANAPYDMKLAHLHKLLAPQADIEVEVFTKFEAAFRWLGFENPDPASISAASGS
jgi:phenylalanine-4-hydroxylase